MSNNNFIISSGILRCTTDFLTIKDPYHINKNPIVTVYSSGDFSNFTDTMTSLNAVIKTVACALPTGSITPTTASGFLGSYYTTNNSLDYKEIGYLNGTLTQITKDINGTPLSGNCYYNIYSTNILLLPEKNKILGFGDLVSSVAYLTRSPYPFFGDVNGSLTVSIEDNGELAGDKTLVNFKFDVGNELYNFANTDNFGVGYPSIAESGLLRITCSGIASGVYFPFIYNGSNESVNPLYQYMGAIPSGVYFKVPKLLLNNEYADYSFNIEYINSSGLLTGPTTVNYTSETMKNFFTKKYTGNESVVKSEDSSKEIIDITGATNRSRLAIGISDIDLVSTQYNEKGVYISQVYTNEKPIYALNMEVNEEIQAFSRFNNWDIVKYYIQLAGDENWYRVSPKPRINELDESGLMVPSVFILDSLIENTNISDIYNTIKFVPYDKPVYSFKVKIEMDTNITGMRGKWTPSIYDYKITVIDKDILTSSNYERYLFN